MIGRLLERLDRWLHLHRRCEAWMPFRRRICDAADRTHAAKDSGDDWWRY